jgi:HAD superfamily hydrolase (TIGR01509 family)
MNASTSATRDRGGFDLVIFDCDGVLVDSETLSCATVARMLSRHGAPCDLPTALDRYLGRAASAITDDLVRITQAPVPAHFVREWRTELFEAFANDLVPIDGVRETIAALNVPYCVASSSDEERIELTLRKTDLWDLFEGRIFSTSMVARGKPAPDLFLLAASRAGVAPGRCAVVEDSVSGISAAKAAGMTAYAFTGGSHFAVVDHTRKLRAAGADHIVESMQSLRVHIGARELAR